MKFGVCLRDVCPQTGMTARAIRHYEQVGLLDVGRDRVGYRLYDSRARGRLMVITHLRRAGLSLAEIGDVLALEDANSAEQRSRLAERLERRLDVLRASATVVEEMLAGVTGDPTAPLSEVLSRGAPRPGRGHRSA